MRILETDRLILRHQTPADLESRGRCIATRMCEDIPYAPITYDEAREELEWHMNGHPRRPELGLWATIHKETGRFICRCGLLSWTIDQRAKKSKWPICWPKRFGGKAWGTEAAQAILATASKI